MLRAELKVVGGKHDGKLIPLTDHKFLIGREEDCHLRPNSENVSRYHCVFTVDEFSVRLRDLGSTNGTILNDEVLKGQVVLKAGDRVQVGNLGFEMRIQAAEQVAPQQGAETIELTGSDTQDVAAVGASPEAGTQTQVLPAAAESIQAPLQQQEPPPVAAPEPVAAPAPEPAPVAAQAVTEQQAVAQPQMAPQQGFAPQPGMDPNAYPQQMPPGYVPQQPMAGYPQQQMPGYPQQPGMYPQQQPYGYPQQFAPQQQQYAQPGMMPQQPGMPYPQQGYGMPQQMPYQPQPGEVPAAPAEEAGGSTKIVPPPIKLPPPEATGAKE